MAENKGLPLWQMLSLLSGTGAGAGYLGAKAIGKIPNSKLSIKPSPKRLALITAALGAAPVAATMDAKKPFQSFFDRDYWKKHPERMSKILQNRQDKTYGGSDGLLSSGGPTYSLVSDTNPTT